MPHTPGPGWITGCRWTAVLPELDTSGYFPVRKKTDANQSEIVAALRKVGASVQDLSSVGGGCPDLLVAFRGFNVLLEVKNTAGLNRVGDAQRDWIKDWRGPVVIVRTVTEALNAIGV